MLAPSDVDIISSEVVKDNFIRPAVSLLSEPSLFQDVEVGLVLCHVFLIAALLDASRYLDRHSVHNAIRTFVGFPRLVRSWRERLVSSCIGTGMS